MPAPGKVEITMPDGPKRPLETRASIWLRFVASVPPVSEESLSHTISSDEALCLDKVPERLLVIGGGVLGVEFACIWNAFGAKVEMVKRSPLILPPVDEEISRRLMPIFKKKGINVNSGIYIKEIRDEGGEKVLIADTKDGGTKEFRADLVLVAMGRVPSFGGIDLQSLGIAHDKRGIKTDDRMETNVPGIYAIGDVVGKTFLDPVASVEGIVAMENISDHRRLWTTRSSRLACSRFLSALPWVSKRARPKSRALTSRCPSSPSAPTEGLLALGRPTVS